MKLHRDVARRPRFEIVPMIDVMFLILASFVHATTSMSVHRGLRVDLPGASSPAIERDEHLMITVTETDEILLEKRRVDLDALGDLLDELARRAPDFEVRINGDERASHGAMVAVLDVARRAGIRRVQIETKRVSREGAR